METKVAEIVEGASRQQELLSSGWRYLLRQEVQEGGPLQEEVTSLLGTSQDQNEDGNYKLKDGRLYLGTFPNYYVRDDDYQEYEFALMSRFRPLCLTILQAKDLKKMDTFGTSDPYVVINVVNYANCHSRGHSPISATDFFKMAEEERKEVMRDRKKTTVKKKTLYPEWNEEFNIYVSTSEELLVMDVMDRNRMSKDDFIGRAIIQLDDLGVRLEQRIESPLVYNLKNLRGQLETWFSKNCQLFVGFYFTDFTDDRNTNPYNNVQTADSPGEESFREALSNLTTDSTPSSSPGTLPDGWTERVDQNGRTYYINHNTHSSQWERPVIGPVSLDAQSSNEPGHQFRRLISEDPTEDQHESEEEHDDSESTAGEPTAPPEEDSEEAPDSSTAEGRQRQIDNLRSQIDPAAISVAYEIYGQTPPTATAPPPEEPTADYDEEAPDSSTDEGRQQILDNLRRRIVNPAALAAAYEITGNTPDEADTLLIQGPRVSVSDMSESPTRPSRSSRRQADEARRLSQQVDEVVDQLDTQPYFNVGDYRNRSGSGSNTAREDFLSGNQRNRSGSTGAENAPLPPGWEQKFDRTGRPFFINHSTRTSQWERPRARPVPNVRTSSLSENAPLLPPRNSNSQAGTSMAGLSVDLNSGGARGASSSPRGSAPGTPSRSPVRSSEMPPGWTESRTPDGRSFFINHVEKRTSWIDPRTGRPTNKPNQEDLGPLPHGWEEKHTADGRSYFINHATRTSSWEDPRKSLLTGASNIIPYSRNYKAKYDAFIARQVHSASYRVKTSDKLVVKCHRESVFLDSYEVIKKIHPAQIHMLKARLWVEFEGEAGLDYGGLAREWFSLISQSMFNPYHGLFEYSAVDNYTLQINPNSGVCDDQHLEHFKFIGRVAGMAVFHRKLLDGFFIRPFYKMMLRKPITLEDMEVVDAEYCNSLKWIKDNDPSVLCMTYTVDEQIFGETVETDLIPGGSEIDVTEENKLDYIEKIIEWRFISRIKKQMNNFMAGFNDVISLDSIQIFDEGELELLLSGIGSIDVKDWKENTKYKGFAPHDYVIQWFWKVVLSYGNEMRSRLLQFVTGTSRVPMNGFKELYGSNGPQLFTIEKWGTPDSLPRAHTCFNRIDLPPYRRFSDLKEKLTFAIEGSAGFGGVD